ncbi:BON domain-containing protein [Synechocystis salina LEGE 06099]|uniref:BON domain-containing protein n=1 Tax=Synechocystis salina TaxID=945780 RepID=UPI0018805C22|nr:BON domain-containing protein [Synechocystis salina]MBE9203445.1 BON domain-containing protein [Synechocystis salina LEGE 06099]
MLNPKANDRSTWVVQREYQDSQGIVQTEYRDSQGQLHTEAKDPAELAKSYESGYVDGVLVEEHNQNTQLKREEAASRNVSRGLLISLIIAGVIGVTGAMAYYIFQVNNPSPLTVVTTPVYQTEPKPSPSPPPVEDSAANNPAAEPVESEPQDVNVTVVTEPAAPAPAPAAPTKAPPKAAVAPSAKTATAPPKAPAIATPSPQAKPIAPMAPVILPPNSPVVSNGTAPSSLKTDNQLKSEIVQEFNKQFSSNLLLVSVNQGNVTISGTAASPEQLEKIEPLLESIAGVKKIDVKVTLKVSSN